jgi:hypothetical protein
VAELALFSPLARAYVFFLVITAKRNRRPDESPSRSLNIVLSVSKDGLRAPVPWFDRLTTGAAQVVYGAPKPKRP